MRNAIVISHERDVDGIAGHVLLRMHLMKQGVEPRHVYIDHGKGLKVFEKVKECENTDIYVVDFNVSSNNEEILKILTAVKKRNCKIFWFDHHKWHGKDKEFREISDVFELADDGSKECAADLLYEKLNIMDGEWITSLAHDHDLRKGNIPEARKLQKIIYVNRKNNKFKGNLIKKLVRVSKRAPKQKERYKWDPKLDEWFKKAEETYYDDLVKVADTIIRENTEGFEIGFVYNDTQSVDATEFSYDIEEIEDIIKVPEEARKHIKQNFDGVEILVMIFEWGKLSLRRAEDSKARLDILAAKLGGRGHDYAAGVDDLNIKDFEEGIEKIILAIKRIGRWDLLS